MTASTELIEFQTDSQSGEVALLSAAEELDAARSIEQAKLALLDLLGEMTQVTQSATDCARADLQPDEDSGDVLKLPHARSLLDTPELLSTVRVAYRSCRDTKTRNRLQRLVERWLDARQYLALANVRLVAFVAKRYRGWGVAWLDLVQEGHVGLLTAVDRFDHRRGCRFAAYAIWWIRSSVQTALADGSVIRVPVHALQETARLNRDRQASQSVEEGGIVQSDRRGHPSPWHCGTNRSKAMDLPSMQLTGDGAVDQFEDSVSSLPPELRAAHEERQLVLTLLATLGAREAKVIRMRFGVGMHDRQTLQTVAAQLGVSIERARQIEVGALRKLMRTAIQMGRTSV